MISSSLEVTLALLLLRSALSQMDVPTPTSYIMAVVTPAERAAAANVTAGAAQSRDRREPDLRRPVLRLAAAPMRHFEARL